MAANGLENIVVKDSLEKNYGNRNMSEQRREMTRGHSTKIIGGAIAPVTERARSLDHVLEHDQPRAVRSILDAILGKSQPFPVEEDNVGRESLSVGLEESTPNVVCDSRVVVSDSLVGSRLSSPVQRRVQQGSSHRNLASFPSMLDFKPVKLSRIGIAKRDLSPANLKITARRICCQNSCLRILGRKRIKLVREMFHRQSPAQQNFSLQQMVSSTRAADSLSFTLDGNSVCCRAIQFVFSVSCNKIYQIRKIGTGNPCLTRQSRRPQIDDTETLKSWLSNWFRYHCDSLPNKSVRHLPSQFTKKEVYNIYKNSDAVTALGRVVSISHFKKVWLKDFPDVKIPATNRFGSCSKCEEYKAALQKAVLPREKGSSLHQLFQYGYRKYNISTTSYQLNIVRR